MTVGVNAAVDPLDRYVQTINGLETRIADLERASARAPLRFATIAARDATLPIPSNGLRCYVLDVKRDYLADGGGWIIMSEPEQTYTPTLVNVTLGSPAQSNTGWFRRDNGFITIYTKFVLGQVGAALTGQPTISLPTGITAGVAPRGAIAMSGLDSGGIGAFDGVCEAMSAGTTVITPYVSAAGGAYVQQNNILAAVPMTWGAADSLATYGRIPMQTRYL